MIKHLLNLLFLIIPVINVAESEKANPAVEVMSDLYAALNLSEKGLSGEVFQLALKGYRKLETSGRLKNANILTIIDFSQSSTKKRLYVVDLLNKTLLFNTYVAHGKNTGDEYAKYFSNKAGSYKSSLGFYITKNHATGSTVGLSLIIDGVEKGFNDNALQREIIMHGAAYATEKFIRQTGRLGRSFGCPSLPPEMIRPVIDKIEEGTCLFIYQQDADYLHRSPLLN